MKDANLLSDNQEFPSACNARAIDHHFALSLVRIPTCRKLQLPPCTGLHSEADRETRANIWGTQCRSKRLGMSRRALVFRGKWIDVLRARLRRRETQKEVYSILPGYIDSGNRLRSEQKGHRTRGRVGGRETPPPPRWIIDLIPGG